ncbi:MAG: hypothetical protein HC785_08070 [Calothrix sp. CSU_2_0]|nr:hypothetical protein [Calothrix sp. CSU_2_0]
MLQNYKTCFHHLTCSLVEKAIKAIAKLVRLLISLVRAWSLAKLIADIAF